MPGHRMKKMNVNIFVKYNGEMNVKIVRAKNLFRTCQKDAKRRCRSWPSATGGSASTILSPFISMHSQVTVINLLLINVNDIGRIYRILRIAAIYKRHLQVGSTSPLSWPSLLLSWEIWSIHDLSITSDNLCQYVALYVFDLVYSDVWQQLGPHRIWEASQLTIFKSKVSFETEVSQQGSSQSIR